MCTKYIETRLRSDRTADMAVELSGKYLVLRAKTEGN
jgi:hypothetical protein